MRFRVRCHQGGGHVHCTVFLQTYPNGTFANCGTLVVRAGEEFAALVRVMSGAEFVAEHEPRLAATDLTKGAEVIDIAAGSMRPPGGDG